MIVMMMDALLGLGFGYGFGVLWSLDFWDSVEREWLWVMDWGLMGNNENASSLLFSLFDGFCNADEVGELDKLVFLGRGGVTVL